MCNYYSRHRDPTRLKITLEVDEPLLPNLEPRYVMRPTNTTRVVALDKDGKRKFIAMRWGLVPPWADDLKTGFTMFNARADTLMEKRSFSLPFSKGRRCLVPVDAFFEFSGPKGEKQPHLFKPRDDRVMTFAGLWESWAGPKHPKADRDMTVGGPVLSYTIITTEPNATVAPVHDRMPVLFTEKRQWDTWLSSKATTDELLALLRPAPDDLLVTHKVMRDLLKVKEPGPEALEPVA